MKRTLAAWLCGGLILAAPVAQSYVLPVIDGAKIAQDAMNWALDAADRATTLSNWITQLENWRQNLANLVRGEMKQIVGQELLDAQHEQQIANMFQQRLQRCQKLTNSVSQNYCTRTIQLEQEKFKELKEMDKLVQQTFNLSINQLIAEQNRTAKSDTGSGVTSTTENAVIANLQKLRIEMEQRQNKIKAIDEIIAQYRQVRKDLTKNQLSGNSSNALGKAAGAAVLQKNASDYRNKAAALRQNSIGISNRF